MEAGKVFLPEAAPWLGDFVEEMACFPNGVHDDVVDATTQSPDLSPRQAPSLSTLILGCSGFEGELDKEALWDKAYAWLPNVARRNRTDVNVEATTQKSLSEETQTEDVDSKGD